MILNSKLLVVNNPPELSPYTYLSVPSLVNLIKINELSYSKLFVSILAYTSFKVIFSDNI